MNEQRVSDLIEQLQRFDGNARIEGYVNLKWNDTRVAVVVTEDNLLEKIDDRDSTIETLRDVYSDDGNLSFNGQPSTGRGLETGVLKADKTEQTVFKRPAVILFPI